MGREPKDPFADLTRHRSIPRPGAARTPAQSPEAVRPNTPAQGMGQDAPPSPEVDAGMPGANLREFLGGGSNRLLAAAMPLIALIGRLRFSVPMPNVPRVLQQANKMVREFEARIAKLGYPGEIPQRTSYVLCTAIDQAVLATPWGSQSEWPTRGLLVTFHGDAWGGERFFTILNWAESDPAHNIDLLEIQYVCLSLGFTGQYQEDPRGASTLIDRKDRLYRHILDVRGAAPERLAIQWAGERDRRHRLIQYVPLWVIAAAVCVVILGFFLVYAFLLHRVAEPLREEFAGIAASHPDYTRVAVPATPRSLTLEQLLRPEEDARVLTVEETDKGTLVSLIADDLFESGSATLNPRHRDSIRKVAEALNQVPGLVLVIGHTDDQPIRSLRYASNVELSRARAAEVKRLLVLPPGLNKPARVSWMGLGSAAPKFIPPELPKNRARNRRVEILLQNNTV
jgi:type VI secretion system protein ImpK